MRRKKTHLGVVWEESVTNLGGVRVQANTHYSEQVQDNEGGSQVIHSSRVVLSSVTLRVSSVLPTYQTEGTEVGF